MPEATPPAAARKRNTVTAAQQAATRSFQAGLRAPTYTQGVPVDNEVRGASGLPPTWCALSFFSFYGLWFMF
jgi:hypothetical protein